MLRCLYFHWSDFDEFLDTHNYITNKLACLVHDGMEHEYVKVIACVCAAFGIHLVIPFHYKTKGNSYHSTLQLYFAQLYNNLGLYSRDSVLTKKIVLTVFQKS